MDDVEKVALERLESANERVCRLRSDEAYQAMLRCPGMQDALLELDQARAAARAALSALGRWQPIETAPKDGTTIQLARASDIYGWVIGYGNWENMDEAFSGWLSYGYSDPPGNLGLAHPTHWRPLPTPPAKGE